MEASKKILKRVGTEGKLWRICRKENGEWKGGLLGYSYGVNKASGGKVWGGCFRRGETVSGLV